MRESIKTTEPLELESTDPELHQKDTILIHNNGFSTTIKFKIKLIWGFGPMYFFCWIQTITESVRKVMRLIFLCKKYPSDGADFLGKHGGV